MKILIVFNRWICHLSNVFESERIRVERKCKAGFLDQGRTTSERRYSRNIDLDMMETDMDLLFHCFSCCYLVRGFKYVQSDTACF